MPESHEKTGFRFTGYNLGKDEFIKKILRKAGFNGLCIRFCTHHDELKTAKKLRQKYFLNHGSIDDSYPLTLDQKDHVHFMFYEGVEIIGYAHIQLCDKDVATMRLFVIDEPDQHLKFGSHFLKLCEKYLKIHDFKVLDKGYIATDPQGVAMSKVL